MTWKTSINVKLYKGTPLKYTHMQKTCVGEKI